MIYSNILITPNKSVKYALKQLSRGGEKCLIVVDKNKKLLGTLSDGDVRKAILKGKFLKDKINDFYQKKPIYLIQGEYSIDHSKDLLIKKRLDLIPIVDRNNKVVDVLFFSNVFKNNNNIPSNKSVISVVIMAGGEGTRLMPFTAILPKPLVPINEKPIIEHIIEKFLKENTCNFFVTVNYKSRIIKAFFDELNPDFKIKFIEEPKPLGTAGSLRYLIGKIRKPFLVTNCDTIINLNFNNLYNYHLSSKNDLTLVASAKEYVIPYGTCKLSKKGFLKKILEKPKFDFLVNIGLYVINPDLLKLIPNKKFYNMTDLIGDARKKNMQIGVYPIDEESWIDVGQWKEYQKAVERL